MRSDRLTELRQYKYFVEIARRGSFTAASKTLHITQSALSAQVMQLERELDCKLFDRGRHGARVTIAGERLLTRAEELLRMANEIERSIGHFGKPRRETLHLGMTMTPSFTWFPSIVAEFERDSESLEVSIRDITTAEIYLEVTTGRLDLGIISTSDPTVARSSNSGLIVTKLFEDDFVLIVPPGHEFTKLDAVPLGHLSEERMIAFPKSSTLRGVTDALLHRESVTVMPRIETGWLEMALLCVSAGLGVLLAPRSTLLHANLGAIAAVDIAAHDPPTRILAALYRADARLIDPIQDLVDRVLEGIDAEGPGGRPREEKPPEPRRPRSTKSTR